MNMGGVFSPVLRLGWTIVNLIIMLGVATGFVSLVISLWKQAIAQEKMAAAFQNIANNLIQQSDHQADSYHQMSR